MRSLFRIAIYCFKGVKSQKARKKCIGVLRDIIQILFKKNKNKKKSLQCNQYL